MPVSVYVKEDISRLVEEGRLDFKLNELDKLERAAKNNPNPAWSVNGIKISSPSINFCLTSNEMIYWFNVNIFVYIFTVSPVKQHLKSDIHFLQLLATIQTHSNVVGD